MFVDACLSKARSLKIGTVSTDDSMTGLKQYQQWVPGAAFYAAVVWGIGLLIVTDRLGDEWLYALGVTATNLLMFYVIKCGISATDIRVTLHRAALAGERVNYLNRRRQTSDNGRKLRRSMSFSLPKSFTRRPGINELFKFSPEKVESESPKNT
jgi:hypothetical protein